MRQRRTYRWLLFLLALGSFYYFVFVSHDSLLALGLFLGAGGLWYWLEQRKMRELDALRSARPPSRPDPGTP